MVKKVAVFDYVQTLLTRVSFLLHYHVIKVWISVEILSCFVKCCSWWQASLRYLATCECGPSLSEMKKQPNKNIKLAALTTCTALCFTLGILYNTQFNPCHDFYFRFT